MITYKLFFYINNLLYTDYLQVTYKLIDKKKRFVLR